MRPRVEVAAMTELDSRLRLAVALVLVVATVAAPVLGVLLVADVSAAGFQTQVSGTTTASSTTVGNASVPAPSAVTVVVRAPESVRPRLERQVREAFAAEGLDVTVAAEIPDGDAPVVVVVVDEWDGRWNPVTPSATVEWRAVYDANGHERHVEAALADDVVVFDSRDGPDLVASGDYRLEDSATGVVSRPAYRRHLADAVAAETAQRVVAEIRRERTR